MSVDLVSEAWDVFKAARTAALADAPLVLTEDQETLEQLYDEAAQEAVEAVVVHLGLGGFTEERREGDDGRGSYPPQPSDRPSTKYVRLVGPWRRVER